MEGTEFIKSILALLAWREERSNQINGMLGVMFVVRNRVHAGWFGGSWQQNIEGHNQFSSMAIRGDSQTVAYPDVRDPQFQRILQYVDGIFDGTMPDSLTGGALYYADLQSPGFQKGGWFDNTILAHPETYPRVAQIGTTTYFGVKQ